MPENPDGERFPFITRKMLAFEGAAFFQLEVVVRTILATGIEVTGITREGPFRFNFTSVAQVQPETKIFAIPDIPIWVTVAGATTLATDIDQNKVFATAFLRINGTRSLLLCYGPIGNPHAITWPNQPPLSALQLRGTIENTQGADPAAGAEATVPVTDGETWIVKAVNVRLVTGATAANRRVNLRIASNDSGEIFIPAAAIQIASTTVDYYWYVGGETINNAESNIQTAPLPIDLQLKEHGVIITVTTALQVGDNFGAMSVNSQYFLNRIL